MKYIEDIDTKNKKVILRLDLNVTLKDGNIIDDTKIKKSIPTIKYLLNNNAHILIMSHLGKIKTMQDMKDNSLKPVCDKLSELINKDIYFVDNPKSDELLTVLDNHELVLMENTRYMDFPDKKESGNDLELAKFWSSCGEVFINDAFGTTHRCHASNSGIAKFLPTAYGFLIKNELVGLKPIIEDVVRPFNVIMGGAKVDDKIRLIGSMLENADNVLVGGGIANTFLKASGYNVGASLYSEDYVKEIKELIDNNKDKISMPIDVVCDEFNKKVICNIEDVTDDMKIFDIGPKTVEEYAKVLRKSKTIFVNGTLGLYEDERFKDGTVNIYEELKNIDAVKIAGGGDAVSSVKKLGYELAFDFLSTGGGATLEYIADKSLKCFEGDK